MSLDAAQRRLCDRSRTALALAGVLILANCGGGGGSSGPAADTQDPTMPDSLTAVADSPVTIRVSWSASADDVGVAVYDVSRDGILLVSVTTTSTVDSGLLPGVEHCYSVSARDAAGNVSAASPSACATPVNLAPEAALSAPVSELTNVDVTFDASAAQDADGTIVQYAFDFGDGSAPQLLGTPTVAHAYASSGTYAVRVTVTDDLGASDDAAVEVIIGIKLSAPVNISRTATISQGANACRASDGSIDIVWEEYGVDLLFARSTDGGQSFTSPAYVIDPYSYWGSHNDYSAGQLKVLEAGGTIHVAATLFDLLSGDAEIFHLASGDHGASFGDPVPVSTFDAFNSYASAIDAEGDGTLSMVWNDLNLVTGQTAVRYGRSVDDGAHFSVPTTMSAPAYPVECAQVLWSTNDVLALWTAGMFGTEQILAARSVDHGASFGTPIDVDQDPGKSWCANVVRDEGGTVYAVWTEGDFFVNTRILFARSTDRGATFSTPVTLSAPEKIADYPSIEVGDGRLVVSWAYLQIAAPAEAYLSASTDGGTTFSSPLEIPPAAIGGGSYEVIPCDATHIGLLWWSPPAPGEWSDIYFARAELSVP